jgi:hypothetical protein
MTDEESSALMSDVPFRNRIKVSSVKYSDTLLNKPVDTIGINVMRSTAKTIQQGPDTYAQQIQPQVVMDPAVQTAGAAITDAALQVTVETVINRSL